MLAILPTKLGKMKSFIKGKRKENNEGASVLGRRPVDIKTCRYQESDAPTDFN